MALVNWSEKYSVGVGSIDNQHKKWLEMINELNDAMKNNKSKEVLAKIFHELVDYTKVHFKYEEDLFNKYNYPEKVTHKAVHDKFVKEVLAMLEDHKSGKSSVSVTLIMSLNDWLLKHIMGIDKKYTDYMVRNNVK